MLGMLGLTLRLGRRRQFYKYVGLKEIPGYLHVA